MLKIERSTGYARRDIINPHESIYVEGDLLTVVRGEESITARVVVDEDGDLYLPHCGSITNTQVRVEHFDAVILGMGWTVTNCVKRQP